MRKTMMGVAGWTILVLFGAVPAIASSVNCGIVNKDLQMGRTPEDISERMMISVEDVQKCAAQAKEKTGAAGGAAPAAAEKPAAAAEGEAASGEHAGH